MKIPPAILALITGLAAICLDQLEAAQAQNISPTGAAGEKTRATETQNPLPEPRNDSFEKKLNLLEDAWRRKDYDLARALTHSLRDTVIQTQTEEDTPGAPMISSADSQPVADLPEPWRLWAAGWNSYQCLTVEETRGLDRREEPIEIVIAAPARQTHSLTREVRVARVAEGKLHEVTSQVFGEVRQGTERLARVAFIARAQPNEKAAYLVFFGNPAAERPNYPTDLITRGEGFGLDIENEHFKAALSKQHGQMERLVLKREHGLELFSGGEGHGEPPGIDWAHDYVDAEGFQKMRISLWETSPDYEVVRGPVCAIIRRWGFPRSPIHPLFTPSRLLISVEYRFYAGLPWFQKIGEMRAAQTFEAQALRDEEWVFSGRSFTEKIWMGKDGRFRSGEVDAAHQEELWGVGFINRQSKDAFVALFLEHSATGLPPLRHNGTPTLEYHWHGQLWSRYPLPQRRVPAGAALRQNNAYVVAPFEEPHGFQRLQNLHQCLQHPLKVSPAKTVTGTYAAHSPGRLARPGELDEGIISKAQIWAALRDCKDAQLYRADASIVDLGFVDDVKVRGDVVTVALTMPHRGRPLAGYFAQGSIAVHPTPSFPVVERLKRVPGVGKVVVEQSWNPEWTSHRLTDDGQRRLGLDPFAAK